MSSIHDQHDGNASLVTLHKDVHDDVVDAVVVPDLNEAIIESGVVGQSHHPEVNIHTIGPTMQTHHLQIDQLNHLNQVQRFRAHQNHQEIHRLSPIRIHPSNVRSKTLEHDAGNQHQHLFDGLQGKDDENNGVHDLSQTHVSVSQGNIFSENEEDEILDQQDEDEDDDEENIEREKDTTIPSPMTLLPSFLNFQSPQVMITNQQVSHMPVQMHMRMAPIFIPQGISGPLQPIPGMPGMVVMSDPNHIPLIHTIQEMDNAQIHMIEHDNHKTNRKARWRPTQEQRTVLENFWRTNAYPDQSTKQQILKQLGPTVTYKQVTSWFKHKRENDKQKGQFQYKFSPTQKFSPDQNQALENLFNEEPYAKGKTLENIANQIGVPLKRVQNWFKHKRSRLAHQGKFSYKPRNLLNTDQITFLRGAYCANSSPTPELCEELATELNVKPEQVTRWFSNERSRKRKRGNNQLSEDSDGIPAPKQRETSKKRRKSKNSTAAGSNLTPTSPPPGEVGQDAQDQANEHNLLDQGQHIHDGIPTSTNDQILLQLSQGMDGEHSDGTKSFVETI